MNAKEAPSLKSPNGTYMEFDIWISSLDLCFEFQVCIDGGGDGGGEGEGHD